MKAHRYFGKRIGGALAILESALTQGQADSLHQDVLQNAAAEAGLSPQDMHALVAGQTSNTDLARAIVGYAHIDEHAQAAVNVLGSGDYAGAIKQVAASIPGLPGSGQLIDAGLALASGDLKDAIAPIVGVAVSAIFTPAVGAAVAGIIMVGEQLLSSLGVLGGDDHCDWKMGATCFKGTRAYGPDDPQWVSLGGYIHTQLQGGAIRLPGSPAGPPTLDEVTHVLGVLGETFGGAVYADVRSLEGPEGMIPGIPAGMTDSPVGREMRLNALRLAFGRTYLANVERGINGHPHSDLQTLVNESLRAWNATHTGPQLTLSPDNPGNVPTALERIWHDLRLAPAAVSLQPIAGRVLHLRKLSRPGVPVVALQPPRRIRLARVRAQPARGGRDTMTANPPTMVYSVQHGQWYQQSDWIPYADAMNFAHTLALQGVTTGAFIWDWDTHTAKWVSSPGVVKQ